MGNLKIFLAVLFNYFAFTYSSLDASKFLVWGPGLNVKIVLPVRYFYVQAVDDNGNKYGLYFPLKSQQTSSFNLLNSYFPLPINQTLLLNLNSNRQLVSPFIQRHI